MTSKAGEYIGEALLSNPGYKIENLNFQSVNFGQLGLQKLCEGSNVCESLISLHVGIVNNEGLHILAEYLKDNKNLKTLGICFPPTEEPWKEDGKKAFANLIKKNNHIEEVKFGGGIWQQEYLEYFEEINFYC